MNDDVNIKRLAHKLKSGCASLGMTQATEACRELELQHRLSLWSQMDNPQS
ncbi:Hpt domain-containing protein [Salmonella enterica subsp. enterica serovar Cerro]|nr:Hpt domain-containing protein [Salmonella enterica subsp. enterica serovar Cerro]